MPTQGTNASVARPDVTELLAELEVPFSSDQVPWRVANTSNDKKHGQVVPYADPRGYTDRLNALFSPQGWTRDGRQSELPEWKECLTPDRRASIRWKR